MGADCLGGQYKTKNSQAKETGAMPIDPKFEGKAANSAEYGDAAPSQEKDRPTRTGW